MAQEDLIPTNRLTEEKRKEMARAAGIASGKARRRNRTVRKILQEYLKMQVKTNEKMKKLAERAGAELEGEMTVEDLFVALCVINTMRDGRIDDIDKLRTLLGENEETKGPERAREDDPLTVALMGVAKELKNADQP